MNSAKRITALVLCMMFVMSTFPTGILSFGGDGEDGNTMTIGYYVGMTMEELVADINKLAGLDEDTPIEEWSWYTNGVADYKYGRYLIDVKMDEPKLDYENINVIRGLEIYNMYLEGEITKEELEEKYSEVDMMFNDIRIDPVKLQATVDDALDAAKRDFRRQRIYVPFTGKTATVDNKLIELDPETDPHCAYDVTIDLGISKVEQTMYFPTRLELEGTETYPSILTAAANGETITAKHNDTVYTIKVYGVNRSDIVLTGKEDYVYPISYNIAAGDVETDILDRIYQTVVDFDKSVLAEDFDIDLKNGFTVKFYDKQTGWYEFDSQAVGRLESGNVYDIEMIYDGDTTDTVNFQIALFDPRVNPSIAIYGDEKLIVEFTDNVEDIKEAVFAGLIDKSDLPEDVSYLDFDYYYMFDEFARASDLLSGNASVDKKFNEFKEAYYDDIWASVEASMGDHEIFDKISKEEFKEKYFTRENIEKAICEERWVSFDGGYYPVTMEIEGTEVVLFEMNYPEVFAATNHKIKVVYRGNAEYAPAETESVEKLLQITAFTSDLDVIDGCYLVGSNVKDDMLVQSYDLDYLLITFEIDTDYLEITNIYVDFPKFAEDFMNIRFENGNEESTIEYLKKYLAKENYKLPDLLDFLSDFENSELSSGNMHQAVENLKAFADMLPESANDAPINYNGLPEKKEGTYFVAAAAADLNAISNRVDYGLCFIVSELDRDYQIIYSNEVPEEGFTEYPDFDFSALVFDNNFKPYENNPIADSMFIGYAYGSEKITLSYDSPTIRGQYIQVSKSSVANPVYRYFDIAFTEVTIESPGDVFEYDGLAHGEPVILDYMGNEVAITDSDRVIYTNKLTNKNSSKAPSAVGVYTVTVMFAGREELAPKTTNYEFRIVPKTVDVWVDDVTVVYGEKLPEFTLNCSDPEILSQMEYTITPNAAYDGSAGVYHLVVNIKSLPEGYAVNKLDKGYLTVKTRAVTIEMNNISIEYGMDYSPDSNGYYTIVEGEVLEGDTLGLLFEKFSNAGEYTFAPYDYTNKNYDVTVIPGVINIEKRKITLTIKDVFMYEGDELPEFSFYEECPADLKIHIAPSYYDGTPGEYLLVGYNDNSNYDVTIYEGTLFVNPKPPIKVSVYTEDYTITYGDKLPEFRVETSVEVEDVEFAVSVGSYNGDTGTYPLTISAVGSGVDKYAFEWAPGKLTVEKKDITVNIENYNGVYGQHFDPKTEYKVSCDDPDVDLGEITFEIGAEGYNGQAGSFLFIGKGVSRNYNVTVKTATLTIDPKEITVIPVWGQGKFEGEQDGVIDYEAIGLIGKDTLEGSLSRVEGEDVGIYEILLGTLGNPNYLINLEKVMYSVRSKDYAMIRIDSLPDNLVYLQGTELNLDGLKVVAVNADGSEKELTNEDFTIVGYDKNKVGEQRLAVHYFGHLAFFNVLVTPTEVLEIKIDKLPSKLVYIEGQQFTADGITVVVFYDNGTYQYVDMQYINFSGFDLGKIGKQSVVAEYGGKTDSFEITVVAKDVSGIEVDTSEVITQFVEGSKFVYDGLKVYLVYNNGTKVEISDGYNVEGYSMNKVGEQTVKVVYGDFTASYQINVIEKVAVKLEIIFDGEELMVVTGTAFNAGQVKVIATFNDGTTKVLKYGEYILSGYDADVIGIWSGEISYGGLTYSVPVRVVAYSIEYIEISKLPNNTVFYQGQPNNIDGIEVIIYYNNGTFEIAKGFEIYGYDADKLGVQTLSVSYLGYKAEYKVTVIPVDFVGIEISKQPDRTEFIEKTTPDFGGIEVYMIYGEQRVLLDYAELTFTGYDMTVIGEQTVSVIYGNAVATFSVNIVEKQIVSLEIKDDAFLVCVVGSNPYINNVHVVAKYDNGEVETVALTVEMLGEYDNQTVGRRFVPVNYKGSSCEIFVWFIADEISEIIISKPSSWTEFTENMKFTADGIEILVKYVNGSFDTVYMDDCEFYGYDMSVIGNQTVTVRYANKTVTYDITVVEKTFSHIEIAATPDNTELVFGQPLDLTGLSVNVYYDNGEFYTVSDVQKFIVTGYSSTVLGEQTVYVTLLGMTTSFNVTVVPVAPVGITLDTSNVRVNYYIHNLLEFNGIKVYLNYNNGTVEEISIDDCIIEGYDPFVAGEQTVVVVYGEFTAQYNVNVTENAPIRVDLDPSQMLLYTTVGTIHDFDKLIVKALYSDGTYSNIVYGAYTVENYDYTVFGVYNAKIVYNEFSFDITLTVLPEFTLESATEGKGPVYTVTEHGLVIDDLGSATTVQQLKEILVGGEYIVVIGKDGEILGDDEFVGTGAKLTFAYDGKTYGEHDIIVKGDVDGDGMLNITDAVIVGHAISDAYIFDKLQQLAADVAENNGFNITDVVVIRHKVTQ